jgi:hypothetical protein
MGICFSVWACMPDPSNCRVRDLMASAPSPQLSQDLLNLDDLFLNFAGYLFTGTFCFQLWIIACFPEISLTLPFV